MAEKDGLSKFDFNNIRKAGKFLKFQAGKPVTIRVLTKDPLLSEVNFTGDDPVVRVNFIVWNFTDNVAQILSATSNMGEKLQKIGNDEDYGANLQKCDIKISPEGEKLARVYDINVLNHSGNEKELTRDQIKEAAEIDLEKEVKDSRGRASEWEEKVSEGQSGLEGARKVAASMRGEDEEEEQNPGDDPINLDEIPF